MTSNQNNQNPEKPEQSVQPNDTVGQASSSEEQAVQDTKFQDLVDQSQVREAVQGQQGSAQAKDEVATLAEENAQLKDQLLRAMADVENMRKRMKQQVEEANQYAAAGFARDVANVVENLYLAQQSIPEDSGDDAVVKSIKEGIDMTLKSFADVCQRHGIERIYPEGEKFDHNVHEAISKAPSEEHESGTVIQVVQAGYKMKDRLLKAAMVVVAA